jgi:hypothetical protein
MLYSRFEGITGVYGGISTFSMCLSCALNHSRTAYVLLSNHYTIVYFEVLHLFIKFLPLDLPVPGLLIVYYVYQTCAYVVGDLE